MGSKNRICIGPAELPPTGGGDPGRVAARMRVVGYAAVDGGGLSGQRWPATSSSRTFSEPISISSARSLRMTASAIASRPMASAPTADAAIASGAIADGPIKRGPTTNAPMTLAPVIAAPVFWRRIGDDCGSWCLLLSVNPGCTPDAAHAQAHRESTSVCAEDASVGACALQPLGLGGVGGQSERTERAQQARHREWDRVRGSRGGQLMR